MNWTVELWHDTTMRNEGSALGRMPRSVVTVASQADADALAAWVHQNHSGDVRPVEWGFEFLTRMHPAAPYARPVTLDAAKRQFQTSIESFDGI